MELFTANSKSSKIDLQIVSRCDLQESMMSKIVDQKTVQTISPRQWIGLIMGVSLHTTCSIRVRRRFRMVAGVGLCPANCCCRCGRTHFGGTAASRIDSRTTKR